MGLAAVNALYFRFGKFFRFFEGALNLSICFVARDGPTLNFTSTCPATLLLLDADERARPPEGCLEIHEHQRPIEAARVEMD